MNNGNTIAYYTQEQVHGFILKNYSTIDTFSNKMLFEAIRLQSTDKSVLSNPEKDSIRGKVTALIKSGFLKKKSYSKYILVRKRFKLARKGKAPATANSNTVKSSSDMAACIALMKEVVLNELTVEELALEIVKKNSK